MRSRFAPTALSTMRTAAWELSGTEDNPGDGRLTTSWMRNEGKANEVQETGHALSQNLQYMAGKPGGRIYEAKANGRNAGEEP